MLAVGGSGAFAATLCTDVSTAAALQNLGAQGCQFGDKIFKNFTYTYNLQNSSGGSFAGDAGTPYVSASQVQVAFSDLNGDPYMPILSIVSTWQVSNGNSGDITLQYDVTAPRTNPMIYSWVSATGMVSNVDPANAYGSYVSVGDSISTGGPAKNVGVELDPPATTSGLTLVTQTAGILYAPATSIHVIKDVYISAGSGANQAILSRVNQGLYESPEPMVSLMVGGGFTLLGLLGARNRKKQAK
jgi:hypothetical protein